MGEPFFLKMWAKTSPHSLPPSCNMIHRHELDPLRRAPTGALTRSVRSKQGALMGNGCLTNFTPSHNESLQSACRACGTDLSRYGILCESLGARCGSLLVEAIRQRETMRETITSHEKASLSRVRSKAYPLACMPHLH